jgi:hypothetical protein
MSRGKRINQQRFNAIKALQGQNLSIKQTAHALTVSPKTVGMVYRSQDLASYAEKAKKPASPKQPSLLQLTQKPVQAVNEDLLLKKLDEINQLTELISAKCDDLNTWLSVLSANQEDSRRRKALWR